MLKARNLPVKLLRFGIGWEGKEKEGKGWEKLCSAVEGSGGHWMAVHCHPVPSVGNLAQMDMEIKCAIDHSYSKLMPQGS